MTRLHALGAIAAVAVVVLTWAVRRGSEQLDPYADVQWDPYVYSYASGD